MAEPVRNSGGSRLLISPDNPKKIRSWPNPRVPLRETEVKQSLIWRIYHDENIQLEQWELWQLAAIAEAYAHIFEIPQREFLPTHSAIKSHIEREER